MNSSLSEDVSSDSNTTHETDESAYTKYPEYQAAMLLWKTYPPIIILLGGFGNIATVFVMRRTKDHNSSQHAILMALAVSDLALLFSSATVAWIWYVFQVDLELLHSASCKFLKWMLFTSNTSSAWLVTCVTVQRMMAVLWPHRVRVMCTVRRTWIIIVVLVLATCALDFYVLLVMDINEDNFCRHKPDMSEGYMIMSWVDACMASIFPSVCMIVCNLVLSATLLKAVSFSSVTKSFNSTSSAVQQNADSRKKTSYRTVGMVLAISCAFLVLTLPLSLQVIFASMWDTDGSAEAKAKNELLYAVTHQLWFTNSAINFLLYCLTGAKFRREFLNWIRCGA